MKNRKIELCANTTTYPRLVTFLNSTQNDFQQISNLLQRAGIEDNLLELEKIRNFESVEFADKGDVFSLFVKKFFQIEEKLHDLKIYIDCFSLNFQEILTILEAIEMIGEIDYSQYQKLEFFMASASLENQINRFKQESTDLKSQREKVAEYVLDIRDVYKIERDQWDDIDATLKKYRSSIFAFLFSKYREAKRILQGILKTEFLGNKESWLECVKEIRNYLETRERIEKDNEFLLTFGRFFNGVNTDIAQIENAHTWLLEFCEKIDDAEYFINHKISLDVLTKMHGATEEIENLNLSLSEIKKRIFLR